MEPNLERELRQLDEATTRDLPADAKLDPETAELREGWSALVRLLEDADATMPAAPIALEGRRQGARRRGVLVLLAVAASLLVSLGVVWHLRARFQPAVTDIRSKEPASPTETVAVDFNAAEAASERDAEFSWDDDLDARFEEITQQIAAFYDNSHLHGSPYQVLDAELDTMREAMDEL
jgi:hypothetical protein